MTEEPETEEEKLERRGIRARVLEQAIRWERTALAAQKRRAKKVPLTKLVRSNIRSNTLNLKRFMRELRELKRLGLPKPPPPVNYEWMEFVIAKVSRLPDRKGYSGPTCELAGVKPGRIYLSRAEALKEALKDAQKLTEHNPVGFAVYLRPKAPA